MAKNDRDKSYTTQTTSDLKPINLFVALAEIEHFSLVERESIDQSKELLTSVGSISFTGTGIREGLKKGLLSAASVPFMFLCQKHMIMFAGTYSPTSVDSLLMGLMSTLFIIGNGILIYRVFANSFAGTITFEAMSTLCLGTTTGKLFTICINFVITHWLVLKWLTDSNIENMAGAIGKLFKGHPELADSTFNMLTQAREILIPAFNFIVVMNMLFIIVTWTGIGISLWKTKNTIAFRKMWE